MHLTREELVCSLTESLTDLDLCIKAHKKTGKTYWAVPDIDGVTVFTDNPQHLIDHYVEYCPLNGVVAVGHGRVTSVYAEDADNPIRILDNESEEIVCVSETQVIELSNERPKWSAVFPNGSMLIASSKEEAIEFSQMFPHGKALSPSGEWVNRPLCTDTVERIEMEWTNA